jgi:hypothetical protein
MVNTLDQAAMLIERAGGQNMFVHMDIFHMYIEEPDMAAAIKRNAAYLGYAHVADSHRGALAPAISICRAISELWRLPDTRVILPSRVSPRGCSARRSSAVSGCGVRPGQILPPPRGRRSTLCATNGPGRSRRQQANWMPLRRNLRQRPTKRRETGT